jgi:polar amino acid transport system substrate-binding protein
MRFKQLTAVAVLVAGIGLAGGASEASADVMDEIKERGKIVVGIRADYRPYGYLDSDGNNVGIEPELARDVAERLGVEHEFVPVVASNRMEFLQQGRIDLLLATMTDTEERRRAVNIVEPNYYSSGTNILAPKEVGFEEWEDLRGRPICSTGVARRSSRPGAVVPTRTMRPFSFSTGTRSANTSASEMYG